MMKGNCWFFLVVVLQVNVIIAQQDDLLTTFQGQKITSALDWEMQRRAEILYYFEQEIYGIQVKIPSNFVLQSKLMLQEEVTYGATAVMHQEWSLVWMDTLKGRVQLEVPMSLFIPREQSVKGVFVSLNFFGNATMDTLKTIPLNTAYIPNNERFKIVNHQLTEASRGTSAWRWPIAEIMASGYALATCYAGDFAPDHRAHFREGVLQHDQHSRRFNRHASGAIGAWAWGLNQMLTALEKSPALSKSLPRIVVGHSRLGKAALWAGVTDSRWDMVISNNSGCLGAAQSKRPVGEDVYRITKRFPYWFARRCKHYAKHEALLQLDQQMLLALAAPRPLYVASAIQDEWADPEGEYLSWCYAQEVYALYAESPKTPCQFPAVNQPQMLKGLPMGYHVRKGDHDITLYDWKRFMEFGD
jgi:hypothetical protein